jgi:hypothetical protein
MSSDSRKALLIQALCFFSLHWKQRSASAWRTFSLLTWNSPQSVWAMVLALSGLSFTSTVIFYAFPNFPSFIFDCLCVFAPMLGYLDQLRRMWVSKSSANFKPDSSLVLLFSNYLRVIYWYENRFATYLVIQSMVTLIVHIMLCFGFFRYRGSSTNGTQELRSLGVSTLVHPFRVKTFIEFFVILSLWFSIVILLVFLLGFMLGFGPISGIVGLISNMIDSFTTFPVFVSVVVQRDISCMTNVLLFQFVVAVCLKAVLFLWRPVPWPFRAGVAVQGFFVVGITVQYLNIIYEQRRASRAAKNESSSDDCDASDGSF